MSKGDETRKHILAQSAGLFSVWGVEGASMTDVMQATGLEKGGIYNHFKSKTELALHAYDYAASQVGERISELVYAHKHAADRLVAMVDAMSLNLHNPVVEGGCPVMNAAIESDDTNPPLKAKAATTLRTWVYMIQRICEKGIARGEIKPETDVDTLASLLVATLEGALMMSKACDDAGHMARAADFLRTHINQFVRAAD